jgi:hypothetical protein
MDATTNPSDRHEPIETAIRNLLDRYAAQGIWVNTIRPQWQDVSSMARQQKVLIDFELDATYDVTRHR